MRRVFQFLVPLLLLLAPNSGFAAPQPSTKGPVLIDTDIGDDIDDAFALALALASPELDMRGITTVAGDAYTRALIVCRLLHAVGRDKIPVASGRPEREKPDFAGQLQYGLRPSFRKRPEREPAVEFLYRQLKSRPGELTLVALGPLTNVSELLTKHPDCKPWIKRLVLMGGAIRTGYDEPSPVVAEWNIRSDIKAAQTVFASGVPMVVAPLDATISLKLEADRRRLIFQTRSPMARELHALYQLWGKGTPTLFDPLAVALCFDHHFCKLEDLRLRVDDQGFTRIADRNANARVATSVRRDEFMDWFVKRLAPKPSSASELRGKTSGQGTESAAKKDVEAFQGKWILLSAERNGQKTPEEEVKKLKLTIQASKFILYRDSVAISEGTFRLDPTRKPKEIDETVTAGPSKGKIYRAIYEIDAEHHKICFAAAGKERPTAFSSTPGSGHLLQVWKRQKKAR